MTNTTGTPAPSPIIGAFTTDSGLYTWRCVCGAMMPSRETLSASQRSAQAAYSRHLAETGHGAAVAPIICRRCETDAASHERWRAQDGSVYCTPCAVILGRESNGNLNAIIESVQVRECDPNDRTCTPLATGRFARATVVGTDVVIETSDGYRRTLPQASLSNMIETDPDDYREVSPEALTIREAWGEQLDRLGYDVADEYQNELVEALIVNHPQLAGYAAKTPMRTPFLPDPPVGGWACDACGWVDTALRTEEARCGVRDAEWNLCTGTMRRPTAKTPTIEDDPIVSVYLDQHPEARPTTPERNETMTTTPAPIKVGDSVQISSDVAGKWLGVTFKVLRLMRTNARLEVPGSAKALIAPIECLMPATATVDAERSLAFQAAMADVLHLGTVVRYGEELYVVLAQTARGYRIVKLGGDGGRYYTNVPRSRLHPIDSDSIVVRA